MVDVKRTTLNRHKHQETLETELSSLKRKRKAVLKAVLNVLNLLKIMQLANEKLDKDMQEKPSGKLNFLKFDQPINEHNGIRIVSTRRFRINKIRFSVDSKIFQLDLNIQSFQCHADELQIEFKQPLIVKTLLTKNDTVKTTKMGNK